MNAINTLAMGFYAAVMLSYDVSLTLVTIAIVAVNLLVLRLASRARDDANRRLLKEQGKPGRRIRQRHPDDRDAEGRWNGRRFLRALDRHARQRAGRAAAAGVRVHDGQRRPAAALRLGVIAVLGVGVCGSWTAR